MEKEVKSLSVLMALSSFQETPGKIKCVSLINGVLTTLNSLLPLNRHIAMALMALAKILMEFSVWLDLLFLLVLITTLDLLSLKLWLTLNSTSI